MSTIGNIIQRVQSRYSKGVESDDTRLMRRHTYDKLLSSRAKLIFNKINKKQFLSKWNYTMLPCVKLIQVSGNDCPCIPAPGCKVLRTEHKLPKPISSISGYMIDAVMSVDGSIIFHEATYKSKLWSSGDKYTSSKPDYFIKDDYLYITITRKLKVITIIGVFNDPLEAENYPSACEEESSEGCPTFPMDLEFPIDEELIDALVALTVEEFTGPFVPVEDKRNDSSTPIEPRQTRRR